MQEIPGFGLVESDNPIVAEVLGLVARDLYPEGEFSEDTPPAEAHARVESSELLASIGGNGLVMDLAEEMVDRNLNPMQLLTEPHACLGSMFCIGVHVGVALARRAAEAPEIA